MTGRAQVHRHRLQQRVLRRVVGFQAARWAPLNASSRLWRRWRRAIGSGNWWTTQQVGSRPTFVGVACPDERLGRAFARELICGGRLWRALRRQHLLFTVHETRVEVRAGLGLRDLPRLGRQATDQVLPAARRTRDAQERLVIRKRASHQRLDAVLTTHPWLREILHHTAPVEPAAAIEESQGKCLVIVGNLDPSEAAELGLAALNNGHWSPSLMGDTLMVWRPEDLQVTAETAKEDHREQLLRFARGFLRQVALSDLHLGVKGRDTFGARKETALLRLLDEVIEHRSTLVLNGDVLELMHESYGAIKRSYPEIFSRLARVRRVVYLPGNHDEDVLRDRIKEVRRVTRRRARRHAFATVHWDDTGQVRVEADPGAGGRRTLEPWRRHLADPRLAPWLAEVLQHRHGSLRLSHGFAREGVAFERAGPRETPDEHPTWYVDESLLREADPVGRILKLVADRRQRLDRVIRAEWGGHVEIVSYHLDAARGLYFEHGHAAVPSCNGSFVGRLVSRLGGGLKRCGLTNIEHLVEERLGRWVRAIYPLGRVREMRQFIERALAVATWITRGEHLASPALFFGHTHESAAAEADPVNAFTRALVGARYGNTGAWSNRLRPPQTGTHRVEWLECDGAEQVAVKALDVAPEPLSRARPGLAETVPLPVADARSNSNDEPLPLAAP